MASLTGSATGHKNAFEKYVKKNPNWSKTMEFVIENGISNKPIWTTNKKILFTVSAGDKVYIQSKTLSQKKFSGDRTTTSYCQVKHKNKIGWIRISFIRKPTGKKNVLEKEEMAIRSMNKALKTIGYPVQIKVKKTLGGGYYTFNDIVKCVNISGTPKADFALVNSDNKQVCWISHKAAGGAKSFQQYSGVSSSAGIKINEHKEVQEFLQLLTTFISDNKLQNPMMVKVRSKLLINYAVYGSRYKMPFGKDNCHLIGQGLPILRQNPRKDDCYYLEWEDGHHTNGDIKFKGGYTPYIGATYRAGRSFDYGGERWRGARVMILPKALMEGRSNVIDV